MADLARHLDALPSDTRIVQVDYLAGFGSRDSDEAVAIDPAGAVLAGSILGGLADASLATFSGTGTFDISITDPDAEGAGLACGGQARLIVTPIDDYRRARVAPTTVRIVGHAEVGAALADQAALLGWTSITVDGVDAAIAVASEQLAQDALVILSHDETIDTAALASALSHGRGYVGALGSRGTQAARRERLVAQGFSADQLASIHGPVGLDLGSRTPAETAVAIVAEIIAFRSGRTAASLATSTGPING